MTDIDHQSNEAIQRSESRIFAVGGVVPSPCPPKRLDDMNVDSKDGIVRIQDWDLWASAESVQRRDSHRDSNPSSNGGGLGQHEKISSKTDSLQQDNRIVHTGGCHCGKIRFHCIAPKHIIAWDCNCSDCRMRRNVHFIIRASDFTQMSGGDSLAEYRWGTCIAKHLFCVTCGITAFYFPRSNPEGVAITFACLDVGTVESVDIRRFDGRHWEECLEDDRGAEIRSMSKVILDS